VASDRPLRLAHRGDWRRATENTIPALLAGLAVPGCDGLEFDVRGAADGVPVLAHDVTLARVFGRPERMDGLTADALGDIGLTTLEDALAAVGRRAFLDVELKVDLGRAAVEILAAHRGPALERAVVSSFDPAALETVGRLAPGWRRWLNTHTLDAATVANAVSLGCQGVSVQWRALDRRSVALARAADLEVAAWTVRRRPTYDRLTRLGVIAICAEAAALDGAATAAEAPAPRD
jgi:glycerophosphoryl diester phosphodiesterase